MYGLVAKVSDYRIEYHKSHQTKPPRVGGFLFGRCCEARTCVKASSATSESATGGIAVSIADERCADRAIAKVNLAVFENQRHSAYHNKKRKDIPPLFFLF